MQQNATAATTENQMQGYCKHGGNMFLQTVVPTYQATWGHNPHDSMKLPHCQNLLIKLLLLQRNLNL
jgi:hypothetical protein